jgi:hypothetical protein
MIDFVKEFERSSQNPASRFSHQFTFDLVQPGCQKYLGVCGKRLRAKKDKISWGISCSRSRGCVRCGRPFRQKTALLAMLLLGTMTLLIFIIASIFASLHPSIALLIH